MILEPRPEFGGQIGETQATCSTFLSIPTSDLPIKFPFVAANFSN